MKSSKFIQNPDWVLWIKISMPENLLVWVKNWIKKLSKINKMITIEWTIELNVGLELFEEVALTVCPRTTKQKNEKIKIKICFLRSNV